MANKLRPFRDYSEHDVINLFAHAGSAVDNGTVVKLNSSEGSYGTNGWRNDDDSNQLSMLGDAGNSYSNTVAQRQGVAHRAENCGTDGLPLGMTIYEVAENDENGEKLLYNPTKQTELQAMLPGQAVPVATKGIFTLSKDALGGGALNTSTKIGSGVKIAPETADIGKVTGCLATDSASFGTIIGTGTRSNVGITTDQFSGDYIVVKIDC